MREENLTQQAGRVDEYLLSSSGGQEEGGDHQQHRDQTRQDDGAPGWSMIRT